jgi:ABC-type transport system involved in multi-copper enzyme maturation permease subunit
MKFVLAVALNTFKEILRNKILLALISVSLFIIGFSYLLGGLSFAEQERIIMNMGLGAVGLCSSALAIFLGGSLVWREIEKQTILVVLSKAISRSQFLLGKYFGLALILLLTNVFFGLLLLSITWSFKFFIFSNFALALAGIVMQSLIVLASSIFFGVFCQPLLATFFSFSIWLLGHAMADLNYFSQKSDLKLMRMFGDGFSKYFINFQRLDFGNAVIYPDLQNIFGSESLISFAVGLAWVVLLVFVSQQILERRDFV